VLLQEPVLYARSIRRNIIFGLEGTPQEPSLDEVINAAKVSQRPLRNPDPYGPLAA
jgi:ABC-type multidrug transport system fused ATPase/permease subunit